MFEFLRNSIQRLDRQLLGASLLLAGLGLAMIYSAGQVEVSTAVSGAWLRQLVWIGLAVVGFLLVSRVPLRWLEWFAPWAYAGSLLLLVLVLFAGTGPGGESWLDLGPVRIQPAEPAKLATILMLARYLSGNRSPAERLVELGPAVAIVLAPFVLVMLQPDLGSALIFGVILVAGLVWAEVPAATILLLVSPGISLVLGFDAVVWGAWFLALVLFLWLRRSYILEAGMVVLANVGAGALTLPIWSHLAPYQQNRLLVFTNPGVDPQGAGWQLIQSKVAIGSGGWLGQGYLEGPQKRLAFLPEQHTDFIFSVVGEELGFLGVLVFLALLAWWLSRVLAAAGRTPEDFGAIASFCLFGVWLTHVVLNVGMTVGLTPIVGLPLPLLSYGGSFLLVTFAGLAVVQRSLEET